jgi:hypothetical protein
MYLRERTPSTTALRDTKDPVENARNVESTFGIGFWLSPIVLEPRGFRIQRKTVKKKKKSKQTSSPIVRSLKPLFIFIFRFISRCEYLIILSVSRYYYYIRPEFYI